MRKILRITNSHALKSSSPGDYTGHLDEATHAYFYFAEYVIHDDGAWEEGRSWAGAISVEELFRAMRGAGLLKEITTTKQSGGE
jgi:hypothetical protein